MTLVQTSRLGFVDDTARTFNILKFSTLGNRGIQARGVGKNLLAKASTNDEARTDAEKFTEADRMELAA